MKNIASLLALALAGCAVQAQAPREPTVQQQLLTTCNYEADVREYRGLDRTKFVNECLAEGRRRQQQVLNACVHEAQAKDPRERREFTRECLRR